MADETIQDDHPDIAPKSAPKPEREPIVIEGEAADLTPPEAHPVTPETPAEAIAEEPATEPEAAAAQAEPVVEAAPEAPRPAQPAPAAQPAKSGGVVGKIAGLLVVVAVSAAVSVYAPPYLNGDKKGGEEHFNALDATLKDEATARQALETRLAKLEGAVANAQAPAPSGAAAPAAADKTAAPDATSVAPKGEARAPGEAAPADAALADKVGKLATSEGELGDRIAKLETALAAQKSDVEALPAAVAKSIDPVVEAVAAISLAQRLAAGEPYAAQFAALAKSGADAGALEALKPYADSGAPTPAKLAVAFAKLSLGSASPSKTEAKGAVVDQVWDKLRGLVKVRPVGEAQGDDTAEQASQISAALARGDVAAALAVEAKLPEAARTAAAGWAKDAVGWESANAAARSLAETALKRFVDAKN